ncbi:MAG TPA: hypothetical protein VFB90_03880 [Dehalococcoidia bacterium]|nr:hypothetical protein [Dehalococcoidia bacterium]
MPDRLQQELDEILRKADEVTQKRPLWARVGNRASARLRSLRQSIGGLRFPGLSISQLLFASLAAIIVGYVFFPGGEPLGRLLIFGGIGGFILAFVLSISRGAQGNYPEKRWRGQPMELQGPSVGQRLRTWWGRWRHRR